MKTKFYLKILAVLLVTNVVYGEKSDTTKKDAIPPSAFEKAALDKFNQYKNNKGINIGVISLKGTEIKINKNVGCEACPRDTKEDTETLKLNRVSITIGSGTIVTIAVETDKGTFFNQDAGISLPHFDEREDDLLFNKNGISLRIGDIISYKQDYGFRYMPMDTAFFLEPTTVNGASTQALVISNSANALFDARVYTDLLGLFANESNGIVQTEIASRILLNTDNIRNSKWYLVSYMKPSLKYARLDKQFQTLYVDNTQSVDRVALYRQANFSFGSMINVIKFNHQEIHTFYFDVGYFASSTSIKDSTSKKTKNLDAVISHLPTIETGWMLRRICQFGVDLSVAYTPYFISKQNDISTLSTVTTPFLKFQFGLSWNPVQFKQSAFFLRFTHHWFTNIENTSFSQFQFGYSKNINELF